MRILRDGLFAAIGLTLIVALATAPHVVSAQCSMMGGGHDHGATAETSTHKHPGSEKKQRQSATKLLADEQGRQVLADAILSDRAFMSDLVARIARTPEGRALLEQEMARVSSSGPREPGSGERAEVYTCSMHPEVTSSKSGRCPKCGMDLIRRAARDRSY